MKTTLTSRLLNALSWFLIASCIAAGLRIICIAWSRKKKVERIDTKETIHLDMRKLTCLKSSGLFSMCEISGLVYKND